MANLAVNVDHIATLRQARMAFFPDPVAAAIIAELAGADGIVVHLREDRRHIQDRDVLLIRKVVQTKLILEMASTEEMIKIALEIRPDLVTLVPEKRMEITTEGGLDLKNNYNAVSKGVEILQEKGIPVSIFIDADPEQINLAHQIKAKMIEIHTGVFCEAKTSEGKDKAFEKIVKAAKLAHQLNLGVNAGHGLCYNTIKAFYGFKEIDEFSIGHSIISRAVMVGLDRAVKEMIELIKGV